IGQMAGARRKKTRSQPHLTSERVRDEALRLIEAEGLEGFSTRKLGRALGVEAMAIYWYYPSKEALLDAVVDLLVSKLEPPAPPEGEREEEEAASRHAATESADIPQAEGRAAPQDFIDALRRLAHSYRALAHAYPN